MNGLTVAERSLLGALGIGIVRTCDEVIACDVRSGYPTMFCPTPTAGAGRCEEHR